MFPSLQHPVDQQPMSCETANILHSNDYFDDFHPSLDSDSNEETHERQLFSKRKHHDQYESNKKSRNNNENEENIIESFEGAKKTTNSSSDESDNDIGN